MTRLRRSDPSGPGYARRDSATGPVYEDEAGNRIVDELELERIRSLVVPPAWKDVWISPDARASEVARALSIVQYWPLSLWTSISSG